MRRTEHAERHGRKQPTAFIRPNEIADTKQVRKHERDLGRRFPLFDEARYAITSQLELDGVECQFHDLCLSHSPDDSKEPFRLWQRFTQGSAYMISVSLNTGEGQQALPFLVCVYDATNRHDRDVIHAYLKYMKTTKTTNSLELTEGTALTCPVVPLGYENGALCDPTIIALLNEHLQKKLGIRHADSSLQKV